MREDAGKCWGEAEASGKRAVTFHNESRGGRDEGGQCVGGGGRQEWERFWKKRLRLDGSLGRSRGYREAPPPVLGVSVTRGDLGPK